MVQQSSYSYPVVAIAGTFDRLHQGHKSFILKAFELSDKVIIGLTSDVYTKSKINPPAGGQKSKIHITYQKFGERKKELENFLKEKGFLPRAEIVEIHDVYGPAIERTQIQALVVTKDSQKGGEEVNRKRVELNLPKLKLIEVPLIMAEDNRSIASTRIRQGEIDRYGHLYRSLCFFESGIPEDIRQKLKKPQGELVAGNPNNLGELTDILQAKLKKENLVITIGDEVTKLFNTIDQKIHIAVIDFKVHRIRKYNSISELGFPDSVILSESADAKQYIRVQAFNPPSTITKNLVDAIYDSFHRAVFNLTSTIIVVDGEDDLAGVPAILLAPLGSVVLYGQPEEGVVFVEVTERIKEKLADLLQKKD
ncbi:pantetheine-phosphate adenylyltransferase [Candidatus Gottesmanbacteria bacterium]|nr:pantetheine-phosphate adenylyltransferase [Candidatus Gottesmanbacteria bacterium]